MHIIYIAYMICYNNHVQYICHKKIYTNKFEHLYIITGMN